MTEPIHCERCGKMVGYGGGIIVDECGCRAADAEKAGCNCYEGDPSRTSSRYLCPVHGETRKQDAEKADEPLECTICGRIDGVTESYCSWCFGRGAREQGKSASKLLHIRLTISRLPSPLLPLRELLARDFELDEEYVEDFVRCVMRDIVIYVEDFGKEASE